MIEYKALTSASLDKIKALYQQHGWLAYLQDDAKLVRAFDSSLYTIGAYDGEELAGFVRCVGDGEHIVLIQDLIVAASHQQQGVGKTLMKMVWEKYADVRMIMLLTDATDDNANAFYQAIGMRKIEQNGCVGYMI